MICLEVHEHYVSQREQHRTDISATGKLYRPCIEHEIYSTLRTQPEVRRNAEAWVGRHEQPPPDTSNARAPTSTPRWQSPTVKRARAREAEERQGSWRERRKQNDSDDDDDLYS